MGQVRIQTDWPAMLSSLLVQFLFLAWLAYLALSPSRDHQEAIYDTLVLLLPFEMVRFFLMTMLSSVYRNYKNRWQAVKQFLGCGVFTVVLVFIFILLPGRGKHPFQLAESLTRPWIWVMFIGPVVFLIIENAESLFLFRGNVRRQAAQLDAMASDSGDWAGLGVVFGGILGLVCFLMRATWQESGEVFLFYAIAYLGIKAIVLSQVYTARFASTGRRVFGAPWLVRFFNKKEDVARKLLKEQQAIAWRREAMSQ